MLASDIFLVSDLFPFTNTLVWLSMFKPTHFFFNVKAKIILNIGFSLNFIYLKHHQQNQQQNDQKDNVVNHLYHP